MDEDLIRAISNAASEYAETTVPWFRSVDGELTWEQKIFKARDLKFTELVVQECAKIADEPSGRQPGYNIKKHFGMD